MIQCGRTRWWMLLHLDEGARHPEWLEKHLAGCAQCRERMQTHLDLGVGLSRSKARLATPPFLATRIIAAVAARPLVPPPWWGGSGRLAVPAALILVTGLISWMAWRPVGPTATSKAPSTELAEAVGEVLPMATARELVAIAGRMDNPLEQELQNLLADAGNAWRALRADLQLAKE